MSPGKIASIAAGAVVLACIVIAAVVSTNTRGNTGGRSGSLLVGSGGRGGDLLGGSLQIIERGRVAGFGCGGKVAVALLNRTAEKRCRGGD